MIKNYTSFFKNHYSMFISGLLLAFLLLFFTYITCCTLQDDGFNVMEMTILTFLPGLYFFLLALVIFPISVNKLTRDFIALNKKRLNRFIALLFGLCTAIFFYFLFDHFLFYFDNSISYDFAKALSKIPSQGNLSRADLIAFGNEPFCMQTGIITVFLGTIGASFSLLLMKKDGILISSTNNNL